MTRSSLKRVHMKRDAKPLRLPTGLGLILGFKYPISTFSFIFKIKHCETKACTIICETAK